MIKSQMPQKWENVYIYYNETNSISLGNVIPLFLLLVTASPDVLFRHHLFSTYTPPAKMPHSGSGAGLHEQLKRATWLHIEGIATCHLQQQLKELPQACLNPVAWCPILMRSV